MRFLTLLSLLLGLSPALSVALPEKTAQIAARKACKTSPKVSFKKTTGLCEATKGVDSYSGYVTIPATTAYPFEQNLFFWFFESRGNPNKDPLAVWMNGGPGAPSTDQALGSNGPCRVLSDSASTENNPWSWNANANLLYIDQPSQTGFSYDEASPGRLGLVTGDVYPAGESPSDFDPVLLDGVFASQDPGSTLSTSQNVARVMWVFMQAWMDELRFKKYARDRVHLWGQSYGGHYVPAMATYFESQSSSPASHSPAGCIKKPRAVRVATVGILAPFIDAMYSPGLFGIEFARNNTYGIELFEQEQVAALREEYSAENGCEELITTCRTTLEQVDPDGQGDQPSVYELCAGAFQVCAGLTEFAYAQTGMDPFDITKPAAAHFPPPYALGFLNQQTTRARLGAKTNYTAVSNVVALSPNFFITGDFLRSFTPEIERLLSADVPVHLVYGDRDYRCNWVGGEALSLSLDHPASQAFRSAGYADLVTADGDGAAAAGNVGSVRQAGLLSFTKVLQSGHEIPYYQPQAAQSIFQRALAGRDIATGSRAAGAGSGYVSSGPGDISGVETEVPGEQPPVYCYVRQTPLVPGQCTEAQLGALAEGSAVVEDFVVVEPAWSAS